MNKTCCLKSCHCCDFSICAFSVLVLSWIFAHRCCKSVSDLLPHDHGDHGFDEEWTGGGQNSFVDFNVFTIFTGQGDIRELFVSSQFFKSKFDIFLEIVPLKIKLF